jgi:hypothetical protein
MYKFLMARKKALIALLTFVVSELVTLNTLHPNPKVTAILTVLALIGITGVHQATNTPKGL